MAGISIATLVASSNLNHAEMLVGGLVFTALVASDAIWDDKDKKKELEKAKHSSEDKLALLMELMDEHEQAAFKESLQRRLLDEATITSDGELSVDDLFYQDANYQSERL